MTFVFRALVFCLAFGAALAVSYLGVDPLGVGLVLFGLFVVVALVWGFRDGRATSFPKTAAVWVLVAVTLGVVMALATRAQGDGTSSLAEDLLGTTLFLLTIVAVPALVGAAVGTLRRATAE